MDAVGASGEEERAAVSVLRGAVSGPDVHDTREAHRRLLQFHTRPAVCPPLSTHPRLLLAAARVSRQSTPRSVRFLGRYDPAVSSRSLLHRSLSDARV